MRVAKITAAQIKAMSDAQLATKLDELLETASTSDGELRHSANGYAQMLANAQVKRATARVKVAKMELAALSAIAP